MILVDHKLKSSNNRYVYMHSFNKLCSELDFGILSEFVCLSQFTHNRESQITDGKISPSKLVALYRRALHATLAFLNVYVSGSFSTMEDL